MAKLETKKKNRRDFFATLIKGGIGIAIFSSIPFSLFAGSKESKRKSKIKVKIHPSAIKRNK